MTQTDETKRFNLIVNTENTTPMLTVLKNRYQSKETLLHNSAIFGSNCHRERHSKQYQPTEKSFDKISLDFMNFIVCILGKSFKTWIKIVTHQFLKDTFYSRARKKRDYSSPNQEDIHDRQTHILSVPLCTHWLIISIGFMTNLLRFSFINHINTQQQALKLGYENYSIVYSIKVKEIISPQLHEVTF